MRNRFSKSLGGEDILTIGQVHSEIKGTKSLTMYMVYPASAGHCAIYTLGN